MTKADIVAEIAEETGLERNEAQKAVEAFMTSIKTSLTKGQNVYLRGFGSFIVKAEHVTHALKTRHVESIKCTTLAHFFSTFSK